MAGCLLLSFLLAACGEANVITPRPTPSAAPSPPWPRAPSVPDGTLDPAVAAAAERLVAQAVDGVLDQAALDAVAQSGDARLGWLLADLLRFAAPGTTRASAIGEAFAELSGFDPRPDQRFGGDDWLAVTNLLLGWDLPSPPGYRELKAAIFLAIEPAWEPFFADADARIDWRWLSWGGVFIDDRPLGGARLCDRSCIPALDDPELTPADQGDWYLDLRPVFGIVVNGDAVAFPKHIMEVHELVNLSVGGRRIGLPYCTLCGSAQAYFTDSVPADVEVPVLRTTGLLSRSNKVMYDLVSGSAFNTFSGEAVSGPLQDAGLVLEQTSVVVTTWGEWKEAHPATRIVAEDGGIGRPYPDDPLGGRDLGGPIFPVGPPDPRLPIQAEVVGAVADGAAIAFPVDQALAALRDGQEVRVGDVEAYLDAGGIRLRRRGGPELPAHESFWFAWSQFHPGTTVWSPLGADDNHDGACQESSASSVDR